MSCVGELVVSVYEWVNHSAYRRFACIIPFFVCVLDGYEWRAYECVIS